MPVPLRFVRARTSPAALTDTTKVNGVARGSLPPDYIVEAPMGKRSLLLHDARRLVLREIVLRQAMRVMASGLVLRWLVLLLHSAVYVAWSASIAGWLPVLQRMLRPWLVVVFRKVVVLLGDLVIRSRSIFLLSSCTCLSRSTLIGRFPVLVSLTVKAKRAYGLAIRSDSVARSCHVLT